MYAPGRVGTPDQSDANPGRNDVTQLAGSESPPDERMAESTHRRMTGYSAVLYVIVCVILGPSIGAGAASAGHHALSALRRKLGGGDR